MKSQHQPLKSMYSMYAKFRSPQNSLWFRFQYSGSVAERAFWVLRIQCSPNGDKLHPGLSLHSILRVCALFCVCHHTKTKTTTKITEGDNPEITLEVQMRDRGQELRRGRKGGKDRCEKRASEMTEIETQFPRADKQRRPRTG